MLVAAAIGEFISLYLWYTSISGSEIICTTACDEVTKGEYGYMLGIPVSAYGVAFYFALIVTILNADKVKHFFINRQLALLIAAGVGYTLYLKSLEIFVIGEICLWCLGSAIMMAIIAIAFVLRERGNFKNFLNLK